MNKHISNIKKLNKKIEELKAANFHLLGDFISLSNHILDNVPTDTRFGNRLSLYGYTPHRQDLRFTKDFQNACIAALFIAQNFKREADRLILNNGMKIRASKVKFKLSSMSKDSSQNTPIVTCDENGVKISNDNTYDKNSMWVDSSYFKSRLVREILTYLDNDTIKKLTEDEIRKTTEEHEEVQQKINKNKLHLERLEQLKKEYEDYLIFEESLNEIDNAISNDNMEDFVYKKYYSVKHLNKRSVEEKLKK